MYRLFSTAIVLYQWVNLVVTPIFFSLFDGSIVHVHEGCRGGSPTHIVLLSWLIINPCSFSFLILKKKPEEDRRTARKFAYCFRIFESCMSSLSLLFLKNNTVPYIDLLCPNATLFKGVFLIKDPVIIDLFFQLSLWRGCQQLCL